MDADPDHWVSLAGQVCPPWCGLDANWSSKREELSVLLPPSVSSQLLRENGFPPLAKMHFMWFILSRLLWLYDGQNINCHLVLSAASSLNVKRLFVSK